MAKAVINLQKESGGIVKISPVDGIGITEVTVPESGELVTKEYVDNGAGAVFVANDPRVKTSLNVTGNAPIYACRAWVNFNGTGTVAIRASGNVSSITDNGTGDYTINYITALPISSPAVMGISKEGTSGNSDSIITLKEIVTNPTASSVRIQTNAGNLEGAADCVVVSVSINC